MPGDFDPNMFYYSLKLTNSYAHDMTMLRGRLDAICESAANGQWFLVRHLPPPPATSRLLPPSHARFPFSRPLTQR